MFIIFYLACATMVLDLVKALALMTCMEQFYADGAFVIKSCVQTNPPIFIVYSLGIQYINLIYT